MAKGTKLKTDGPEFSRTLCAVLVELVSTYDAAVAQERKLVNDRTKIEKDLARVGYEDSPEANRVRVSESKIRQALKACRAEIDHLGDQMRTGIKYGQQPMLIQGQQEDRILELVAGKQDVEHRMELWESISSESRKVGSQTGEGGDGPVGEPNAGEEGDGEDAASPAAHPDPDHSAFPHRASIRITRKRDGKVLVERGVLEYHSVQHGYATVCLPDGSRERHELVQDKLEMAVLADTAQIEAPAAEGHEGPAAGEIVRVLHRVTGEHKGDGKLERRTDDYVIVNIGGKSKRFELDVYSIEATATGKAQAGEPEPGVAGMIRAGEVVDGSTGKPAKTKSEKSAKSGKKKSAAKA